MMTTHGTLCLAACHLPLRLLAVMLAALFSGSQAEAQSPSADASVPSAPRTTVRPHQSAAQKPVPSPQNLTVNTQNRPAVVSFYNNTYVPTLSSPIGWTGQIAGCNAGTTNAAFKDAVIQAVNYFRAMTGLPGNITRDPALDQKCQEAALMMIAQPGLSHAPPPSWACFTAIGAEAAAKSNLAVGKFGAAAVSDLYMADSTPLNVAVGHRRWILYPPQVSMGTGDTNAINMTFQGSNALWILGVEGTRPATPEFVAWPPAGFIPYQVTYARWSFSFDFANFLNTTITMSGPGGNVPLTIVSNNVTDVGDNTIVWEPAGIALTAGLPDRTYHVILENVVINLVPRTFSYDVTIIDPALVPTPTPTPTRTPTPTSTPALTPTPTPTPTQTPTQTPSPTPTISPTPTASPTPTVTPTPTPFNEAAVVSQTIPAQIPLNHGFPVEVKMQNTGTLPWSTAASYSLAVIEDGRSLSDITRLSLGSVTVNPGESFTFTHTLTGPPAIGSCTIHYRMVQEFVEFFGETLEKTVEAVDPVDGAQFLSHTLPVTLQPFQSIGIGINVRNTGNTTWIYGGDYGLAVVSDPCSLFAASPIPPFSTVFPNQMIQLMVQVTAPALTGGCAAQLRMQSAPGVPFGPPLDLAVEITEPENAAQDWAIYQ